MKKNILLSLLFLSFVTFAFAQNSINKAIISWSYPGTPSTNNIFKIYRTTDSITNSTRCWTVINILPGNRFYETVEIIPNKQNYFFVTVSNVWGESMFFQNRYITPLESLR